MEAWEPRLPVQFQTPPQGVSGFARSEVLTARHEAKLRFQPRDGRGADSEDRGLAGGLVRCDQRAVRVARACRC